MLLEIKNIRKSFHGRWPRQSTLILNHVNMELNQGETIGITGKSGAGKSILGRIIAGILKPDQGQIVFNGQDIWSVSRRKRKRFQSRIQVMFQDPQTAFNPKWSLARSLEEPFKLHDIPFGRKKTEKYLAWMGLDMEVMERYPSQLSGGELQRVAMARALCLSPSVLVLDEPTSMLDVITQARIIRRLMELQAKTAISYILITHDHDLADFMCSRTYDLNKDSF